MCPEAARTQAQAQARPEGHAQTGTAEARAERRVEAQRRVKTGPIRKRLRMSIKAIANRSIIVAVACLLRGIIRRARRGLTFFIVTVRTILLLPLLCCFVLLQAAVGCLYFAVMTDSCGVVVVVVVAIALGRRARAE